MNFIALCLIGKEWPGNIDEYIEAWHDGREGQGMELREYLGFTEVEYGQWLESQHPANTLHMILHCR